jgi:hypothetical protein
VNSAVDGQDSRLLLGGSARLAVDVGTSVVSDLLLFHTWVPYIQLGDVLESNKPGRVWLSTALGHRCCGFSLVSDYLHRARCGPRALAQSLKPEGFLGLAFD